MSYSRQLQRAVRTPAQGTVWNGRGGMVPPECPSVPAMTERPEFEDRLAWVLCRGENPCWSMVAEIMNGPNAHYYHDRAAGVITFLREEGILKWNS